MNKSISCFIGVFCFCFLLSCSVLASENDEISSQLSNTASGELILTQTVLVKAPIAQVWSAYTTQVGWENWAAPTVDIDLRAGGWIKTNYNEGAKIGDEGTNTLNIVNYVPERVLTLRAELTERWPEVMKADDGKLMNVIVFEPIEVDVTEIRSYGVGYRDLEEYKNILDFFIPANESLFMKLKNYLE